MKFFHSLNNLIFLIIPCRHKNSKMKRRSRTYREQRRKDLLAERPNEDSNENKQVDYFFIFASLFGIEFEVFL